MSTKNLRISMCVGLHIDGYYMRDKRVTLT
jgi:hypothetical protein